MVRVLAIVAALIVAGGLWVWLTDTDVDGGDMPEIEVEGGEMPDVDVRGPEVTTGEEEVTIDVPTVDIEPPEDDADGAEDEIADDEGFNEPDADVDPDENEENPPR